MNQYEIKLELGDINEKLGKYENNKIALRKNALSDLYTRRRNLIDLYKRQCVHDRTVIMYGYDTDVGYGLDRYYYHYHLKCNDCGKTLIQKGTEGAKAVSEEMSLAQAVEAYLKKESLNEDELDSLGMRRITKTTTTYELVKR